MCSEAMLIFSWKEIRRFRRRESLELDWFLKEFMVKFVWVPSSCIATLVVVRFYLQALQPLSHIRFSRSPQRRSWNLVGLFCETLVDPKMGDVSNGNWIYIDGAQKSLAMKLNFFHYQNFIQAKPWPESVPHWKIAGSNSLTSLFVLHSCTVKTIFQEFIMPKLLPCNLWGTYVHFVSIWGCKSLHSHSVGNWPLVSTMWTSQHFAVRKGNCGTRTSRCVCWKFRIINLGPGSTSKKKSCSDKLAFLPNSHHFFQALILFLKHQIGWYFFQRFSPSGIFRSIKNECFITLFDHPIGGKKAQLAAWKLRH